MLPAEKLKIMHDTSVGVAEKVALFNSKLWPKLKYDRNIRNYWADDQRKIGNQFYMAQEYNKAIWKYNRVLILATSSETLGIAYANRSAAYFALSLYEDCLDSARLAKTCTLSTKVLHKVLARERMAIELNAIKVTNEHVEPTHLSYRRHKLIPSFVHCLAPRNPFGGIITTKNLLPGDVLVVEPPLATLSFGMCGCCLRTCGSLQPCECGSMMFCSPKCKADAFAMYHNYECPLMTHLLCFSGEDNLSMRIFFKLIQRFKDVQSLKEYLENIKKPNPCTATDAQEWPDKDSFESQFRIFYATEEPSLINCTVRKRLCTEFKNPYVRKSLAKASISIDLLKTCKEIPMAAKTAEEWSFLSELLFRLFCYNMWTAKAIESHAISYVQRNNPKTLMKTVRTAKDATAIHGVASLFRSSCEENILMDYVKDVLVVRAIKFIPRKTELLCSIR